MRIHDLGPLQVEVDGRLVAVPGRRGSALAALLVHVNRRVSVDLLLDAVWADNTTARSASTLETLIWRLRQLLEPRRRRGEPATVILNDSGGYRLLASGKQADSIRFDQLALDVLDMLSTQQFSRAIHSADEALSLWRAPPFDLLVDRSWAVGPIARLVEVCAQVQERRIGALLGIGRHEQAVVDLELLLSEHPLRERLWAQRMLALHRCGRTDEALRAFHAARALLLDEIGVEPGRQLVELQRQILSDDASLQAPAPSSAATPVGPVRPVRPVEVHLPRPRRLLGREADLEAVLDLVRSAPLVSLVGAAGCGKTVLAIEAARESAPSFPDGVWFVDLSAVVGGSDVAATIARALSLDTSESLGPMEALDAFAADRRALLVLDNCEQVLDEVGTVVERLLEVQSQARIITTTREPLNVLEEQVFQLDPLPVSDSPEEGDVRRAHEASVQLFLSAARLGGALKQEELAEVRRICRAVDGLPLAIELAASLTATFSLAEVAEQVELEPADLAVIGRGQGQHHRTLLSAVERSYTLLGSSEQRLHRRLAVLPGPFGRDLAHALAGPQPTTPVAGSLARLVHSSLLRRSQIEGRTWFSQLAPIRGHAAHVLRGQGEVGAAETLRDDWVAELVGARPRTGRPEEASWYATLDSNLATVRAVLGRAADAPGDHTAAALNHQLTGYWYYRDRLREGVEWAEAAVKSAVIDSYLGIMNRLALVTLLAMRSQVDRSRQLAIDVFDRINPAPTTGFVLPDMEHGLARRDQLQLAESLVAVATAFSIPRDADTMRRALALVAESGLLDGDPDLAAAYGAASSLCSVIAAPSAASLALAESAFDQAEVVGNLWAGWISASSAAAIALGARDPRLGLLWSQRVIQRQTQLGARTMMAQVETYGDFLALDGQLGWAVQIFAATRHHARRVGHPWPRNDLTTELLSRCQSQLSDDEFDQAWSVGPSLDRHQLAGPSSPPINEV